jgi:hypothetical protein
VAAAVVPLRVSLEAMVLLEMEEPLVALAAHLGRLLVVLVEQTPMALLALLVLVAVAVAILAA